MDPISAVWLIPTYALIAGGAITGGLEFGVFKKIFHHHHHHRDVANVEMPQAALCQINGTHLRGRDVDALRGMKMEISGADSATFEAADGSWKAKGGIHWTPSGSKGLITGDLSFTIPGLDVEANGSCITVNHTHEKATEAQAAFDKLHDTVEEVERHQRLVDLMEHIAESITNNATAQS